MRGWRGVAAGVLTLVMLEVLGAGKGPEQGGKLLGWAVSGLRRVMSAEVPALPTVGKGKAGKDEGKQPAQPARPGEVRGELPRNPPVYV